MVDDTRRERDTDRQAKSEMPKSNDADFGVDRDSPKPSEAAESATEMPKPSPKMPNVSKLEDKHEARKQDPLNYALGKLDNMADQIRKTLENRPKFDEPVFRQGPDGHRCSAWRTVVQWRQCHILRFQFRRWLTKRSSAHECWRAEASC